MLGSCVGFSTNKTIFGCVELNVSVGLSRQVEGVISEVTVLSLSYHVRRQKYPSSGKCWGLLIGGRSWMVVVALIRRLLRLCTVRG